MHGSRCAPLGFHQENKARKRRSLVFNDTLRMLLISGATLLSYVMVKLLGYLMLRKTSRLSGLTFRCSSILLSEYFVSPQDVNT